MNGTTIQAVSSAPGASVLRPGKGGFVDRISLGACQLRGLRMVRRTERHIAGFGGILVAAEHFGVPHPTGYPLWTLLNWLFVLLPLGNAAWEVAISSGLCAAAAVGLCAALLSNTLRWFCGGQLARRARWLPHFVAVAFALALAFSQSMWSQAVIAEVYALHALLIALFLTLCYAWVLRPRVMD